MNKKKKKKGYRCPTTLNFVPLITQPQKKKKKSAFNFEIHLVYGSNLVQEATVPLCVRMMMRETVTLRTFIGKQKSLI